MDGPLAVTGWARLTALHTGLVETHAEMAMDALERVFETDGQVVLGVIAALGTLVTRGSLERVGPAKHVGENVGAETSRESLVLRPVWIPKLVKVLALLRVGQNVVGPLDFLELLWITAFVGVVLHSKFAIGLLHVRVAGVFLEP
jgi:hypothetical protein